MGVPMATSKAPVRFTDPVTQYTLVPGVLAVPWGNLALPSVMMVATWARVSTLLIVVGLFK